MVLKEQHCAHGLEYDKHIYWVSDFDKCVLYAVVTSVEPHKVMSKPQ